MAAAGYIGVFSIHPIDICLGAPTISCTDLWISHLLLLKCLPLQLKLKVGMPIILMRNLDFTQGLANGTRLIVVGLGRNIITAKIMTGSRENVGKVVLIPRIPLTPTDSIQMPIMFTRKQFPIRPAFAMTINKSQGQTFEKVGIYLPRPVFSHGQLYVAMSRVGQASGIRFLVLNGRGSTRPVADSDRTLTPNIVYHEVFDLIDPAGRAAAAALQQEHADEHARIHEGHMVNQWPPSLEAMGARIMSRYHSADQWSIAGAPYDHRRQAWLHHPLIAHAMGAGHLYPAFPVSSVPRLSVFIDLIRGVINTLPTGIHNARTWDDVTDRLYGSNRRVITVFREMVIAQMAISHPDESAEMIEFGRQTAVRECQARNQHNSERRMAAIREANEGGNSVRIFPPRGVEAYGMDPSTCWGIRHATHRGWFLSPLIAHAMGAGACFPEFLTSSATTTTAANISDDTGDRALYDGWIGSIRSVFFDAVEEGTFEYRSFASVAVGRGSTAGGEGPLRISDRFQREVIDLFLGTDQDNLVVMLGDIHRHMCTIAFEMRREWNMQNSLPLLSGLSPFLFVQSNECNPLEEDAVLNLEGGEEEIDRLRADSMVPTCGDPYSNSRSIPTALPPSSTGVAIPVYRQPQRQHRPPDVIELPPVSGLGRGRGVAAAANNNRRGSRGGRGGRPPRHPNITGGGSRGLLSGAVVPTRGRGRRSSALLAPSSTSLPPHSHHRSSPIVAAVDDNRPPLPPPPPPPSSTVVAGAMPPTSVRVRQSTHTC